MQPFDGLISVAIPTIERDADVRRLVASLLDAESPGEFEILVADQSPENRAARVLKGLDASRVRWLRSPRGKCRGLNHALREARGTVFACLDDDVTVAPDWFSVLRRHAAHPECDSLWGSVRAARVTGPGEWIPVTHQTAAISYRGRGAHSLLPGMGANLAFRTDVLRAIGGFDEALGPGTPLLSGEDGDVAARIAHGSFWTRFDPQFAVYHWSARRDHDGTVDDLHRCYQRGNGGLWMKQLRLGDWRHVLRSGRRLCWIRPWFSPKKRHHQRLCVRAFIGGAWWASRLPLDRQTRLFRPRPAPTAGTSSPADPRSGPSAR